MNGIVQYENNFKTETELKDKKNEIVINLSKLLNRLKYKLYIKQEYIDNLWLLEIHIYNEQ